MLEEIEFHTGLVDKLDFACRLLRKAYARGSCVSVVGDDGLLRQLDALLWSADAADFVPHLRLAADGRPASHLARTPLWLLEPGAVSPHRDVLVNLAEAVAVGFDAFTRVIEVVTQEPQDRQAGRQRWRYYEGRGLRIKHHAHAVKG